MKKIALTHCYTDKNRGDAGIIQATSELFKEASNEVNINYHSVYGSSDERLKLESSYAQADNLYPALFPEPITKVKSFKNIARGWEFIKSGLVAVALLFKIDGLNRILLKDSRFSALKNLREADLIISKGGSYLYALDNSIRSTLSLIRFVYPFIFAKVYKKKVIIFSQSLGPIKGRLNKLIFYSSLKNIDAIYLRESLCLEKYPAVRKLCSKVKTKIIPDAAFYISAETLSASNSAFYPLLKSPFVALTVVDQLYSFDAVEQNKAKERYISELKESIEYCINIKKLRVIIVPQVSSNNSHLGQNDEDIAENIISALPTDLKKNCNKLPAVFSAGELTTIYASAEFTIGTRLHSTIFSVSQSVPVINIAYHGTKAQGILGSLPSLDGMVLDISTFTSESVIQKIDFITENNNCLRKKLKCDTQEMRHSLLEVAKDILNEL